MEYPEANTTASVPDVVMGVPDTVNPVGTVIATEVTVPAVVLYPCALTYAVVATLVSLLAVAGVTERGLPVNVGEAKGA